MHRGATRRRTLGKLREFLGVSLDQAVQVGRPGSRGLPQRLDELGDDTAQIADQRHVEPTVDADRGRVLLDIHPFAVRIVAGPMLSPAVVHRLTEFGTQRDAQVGFFDSLVSGRGEQVGERPLLQSRDERRATGRLDHRAGHQFGELLDLGLGARRVNAVAHQQDRALGFADQLHSLCDLTSTRTLVDQAVIRWRGRLPNVELLQDHVGRKLDVGRTGCARHRPANSLVHDLICLVGVLDRAAVLDRGREKPFLLDELDAATTHAALGDARPLTTEEDHRRVLHQGAHHRPGNVGDARSEGADTQTGLAGHPGGRLRHEPGAQLVVRCHDRPTAGVGFGEHVHEVGVRYAEQRVDALGLEQVENAFVDGYTHVKLLDFLIDSVEPGACGEPQASRTVND